LGYPFKTADGSLVGLFLRIPRQGENRFAYLGRKCLMTVERDSSEVILCEGLRDLVALSLLFPDKSIVAFAGNPSDFALQELKKFVENHKISKILTAFDNDDTGAKLLRKVAKILPVARLVYEGKDPFEFFALQQLNQTEQRKNCLNCGKTVRAWQGEYCHLRPGFVSRGEICERWMPRKHEEELLEYIRQLNEQHDDDFDLSP